jgi:hypothetical protein
VWFAVEAFGEGLAGFCCGVQGSPGEVDYCFWVVEEGKALCAWCYRQLIDVVNLP